MSKAKRKAERFTVHGHIVNARNPNGCAHWTRADVSRSTAYRLARAQRAEGGIARVVPYV